MKTNFPDLALDLSFHPVQNDHSRHFTREEIEQFNRDGYIAGVTIFEDEQLNNIQSFFARDKEKIKSHGGAFQSFHHAVPELYDIVTNPLLCEYLRDLLGPNIVCYISEYICKEPRRNEGDAVKQVVWHQDASYNPMDARSLVVWLAVDDAFIENGCMWFVPGSHQLGGLDFNLRAGNETTAGGNEVANAEEYGEKVPIELKAGQVVFFSDLLLHSSPPNSSQTHQRGGFTATFTSTEVVPYCDVQRGAVLCSGQDESGHWKPHPRPERED